MYLVSLFGFSFAILSMAEMSSMYVAMGGSCFCIIATNSLRAPTSGGQYRLVTQPKTLCRSAYQFVAERLAFVVGVTSMLEQNITDSFAVCPRFTYPSTTSVQASCKHSEMKLTADNRLGLRILSSTSAKIPLLHHRLAMRSRLASQHRIWLVSGGHPGPGHHHLERPKLRASAMARHAHDHCRGSHRDSVQYFLRQEASID